MDPPRWRRVEQIFQAASERMPEDRKAFLAAVCGGDEALRREVDSLFSHHTTDGMQDWLQHGVEPLLEQLSADGLLTQCAATEDPFRPGQLLDGRFRIVREIARGGMGIVYEAFDHKLERRIAIKCAQSHFRDRLPREVRNASEISHPNICRLFEIHTATTARGEIEFLTMEFLEGETLAARLRRGPLPREQARIIAQQICAGLAEAHRDNVIHGDLKSGNIILTASGDGRERAVITDFGLARKPASALQTVTSGPAGGTPEYMAPELWRGERASTASDIYALGVILCEIVSGHRPSEVPLSSSAPTVTLPERPREARRRLAPRPVDPRWDRVLARCLDPDPARRFRNADEVAKALAPRSRRWLLAAAASLALALLTGLFTYRGAVAPQETVRLAVLPFHAAPDASEAADTVLRDASAEIARLKSSSRTALRVIPPGEAARKKVDRVDAARGVLGATHALHGTLGRDRDRLVLHAYLTDARSGINTRDWEMDYPPQQVRFAGKALAGIVSGTLHLPPPPSGVNAAARDDYVNGVGKLRSDIEVDAALASLERAVAADPESALTYAELSRAEWLKYSVVAQKLWLERATNSLREAERRNPDLPQVHIMAGVLKAYEGWYEQAAAEYRRTIEIDSRNGDAFRRLGAVYEHNNQAEEALAAYRQAVYVDPDYYRNHQNLGSFFFKRGNYAEALKHLERTVQLAPNEPHVHFALAAAYQNLGRFGEAERQLRLSLSLNETPEALETLGQVLMYEEREREAVDCLQRASALNPQQCLLWLYLGIALRRLNLPAEEQRANRQGLEIAERELVRDPRAGDIRCYLAYLCARLGNRARAESEVAQALRQAPADSDARWMAALTYEALGSREATLAILKSAPPELVADLNRWPDAAELRRDPRFRKLLQ